MKQIILILSFMIQCYFNRNPGLVAQLDINKLNDLKPQLMPIINKFTEKITVTEDREYKEITIKKILTKINPLNPEDIVIKNSTSNELIVIVSNLSFDILTDIDVSFTLLNDSGKVRSVGFVNEITICIKFKPYDEKEAKPYIEVDLVEFVTDTSTWKYIIDMNHIPKVISNSITDKFKSFVIRDALKKIIEKVNSDGRDFFNSVFQQFYPNQLDSKEMDLSVITRLVDKPNIKENKVLIPIDGCFFRTDEECKRTEEPGIISTNQETNNLVEVFVSEFSIGSLFDSLYNKDIVLHDSDILLTFRPRNVITNILFEGKKIKVKEFASMITIKYGETHLQVDSTISSEFKVKGFDSASNTISLQIAKLDFNEFELQSNIPFLSNFSYMVKYVIYTAVFFKDTYSFAVPDFSLPFGIKINNLSLEVLEKDIKIGVDLDLRSAKDIY